eukprot:TRINITY_DN13844_c0_g1_i1.p1 TRINITY_DN13844_c0_g1~~TRINITY_DN13844_c0_g1_i1.p1  ORF type:complete len:145 (+),score=26.69 TRINITY_DN13844_c0_g1_i1:148-582(+)
MLEQGNNHMPNQFSSPSSSPVPLPTCASPTFRNNRSCSVPPTRQARGHISRQSRSTSLRDKARAQAKTSNADEPDVLLIQLVMKCCISLDILERPEFVHFCSRLNYQAPNRGKIYNLIHQLQATFPWEEDLCVLYRLEELEGEK